MNLGDGWVKRRVEGVNRLGWQGFLYVGSVRDKARLGRGRADLSSQIPGHSLLENAFALSSTQVGDRVRILALNCGEANNRLMGMGFMPDAVLEVMSRTATGSIIVAVQDQRLGLGADMAQRIQVTHQVSHTERPSDQSVDRSHLSDSDSLPSTPQSAPVKLRDAAIGAKLRVVGYEPVARDYKRKLLAMGLTPGTELRVTRHAPLGDPTEIEVRNYHLSLRKDEADALRVELISGVIP